MSYQVDLNAGHTEIVMHVHGTFAYHDQDDAIADSRRWWQRGSVFCDRLKALFLEANPDTPLEFRPFRWSGANRESSRLSAARLLLKSLKALESEGHPYHVIAHSHGGSVLWEALCSASRDGDNSLPNLRTWTTVGTPFLKFVPDLVGLMAVVPLGGLLILCLVLNHQHLWWIDFWTEFAGDVTTPWYRKAMAAQVAYLGLLLVPALLLHMLFRAFALWRAQHDARTTSDSPRYELIRFGSSAGWTTLWMLLLGLAVWLLGLFHSLSHITSVAIVSTPAFLVSLYAWAAIAVIGVSAALLIAVVWRGITCIYHSRKAKKAWNIFGKRYRYLSSLQYDEATRALAAITNGIKGPLLPRLAAPGAGTYSDNAGRLTMPERGVEPWHNQLLMPMFIVRDWLIRPFYNDIIARLLDDFVLRQLTRQAHGADMLGLRLGVVDVVPIAKSRRASSRNWRLRDLWTWCFVPVASANSPIPNCVGLTREDSDSLLNETQSHAIAFVNQIRHALGISSPVPASLSSFLQRAMSGDTDTNGLGPMDLLVHTQYFNHEAVIRLLATCLTDTPISLNVTASNLLSVSQERPETVDNRPQDFISWLVRLGVFATLLLVPAIVVWGLGNAWVYPYSREAALTWATDVPRAFVAAVRQSERVSTADDAHTPTFVRWYACMYAARQTQMRAFDDKLNTISKNQFAILACRALAAEKLSALGESEAARRVLVDVNKNMPSEAITPSDRILEKRIKVAVHRVSGLSPLEAVKETTSAENNLRSQHSDLCAFADWVAARHVSFDDKRPAFRAKFDPLIADLQLQGETHYLLDGLIVLLIVHQELLEQGAMNEASVALDGAIEICGRQEQLCSSVSPSPNFEYAVESYVLTAKSCRWHVNYEQTGIELLRRAERCAHLEVKPLDQIQRISRVAAGYARSGMFSKARELMPTEFGDSQQRLLVAKDILVNEYEVLSVSQDKSRLADNVPRRLGQIRKVFDEQLELRRGGYDSPQ